jgi:hypothetical protein
LNHLALNGFIKRGANVGLRGITWTHSYWGDIAVPLRSAPSGDRLQHLVAGHRADQIVALTLRGFQDACQWTKQRCREIFDRSWWKENIVDPDGN